MFIKAGKKYINLNNISYFEETVGKKDDIESVQIFFTESTTNSIKLNASDARNFLDWLHDIDEIHPQEMNDTKEQQFDLQVDSTASEIPSALEELAQEVNSIKTKMEHKLEIRSWTAKNLRRRAQEITNRIYDTSTKRKYASQIKTLQAEAFALSDNAEAYAYYYIIDNLLMEPIINVQHIERRNRDLVEAQNELKKINKLTDDYNQKIRTIKEQAAWFRAKKKLAEAEIAMSTGNTKKAEKLHIEASTILKQDWATQFPAEDSPKITYDIN